uniref:Uncharacterized protein n=1 Tax=Panagrolaimus davidi TaxID=227884 RepID=A0A914PV65_9BILA
MLGLDAGCTIGDFWLLWLSKKRMNLRNAFATSRHLRTMPEYYQLSQSYQLRENKVTTALVFPFVIAHSFVFFTYLILTTTFRLTIGNGETPVLYTTSVEGAHVIVTIYTFATLYLLWFLHQRIYHQRSQGTFNPKVCPQNEADVYFKMFNSQITG